MRRDHPPQSCMIHPSLSINELDVLIPAVRPMLITRSNVARVRADVIVSCSNVPVHESAEKPLAERGIIFVPDFVSNAGGVLGGFLSRLGIPAESLRSLVRREIRNGVTKVMTSSQETCPAELARQIANEKLDFARHNPFLSKLRILCRWRTVVSSPQQSFCATMVRTASSTRLEA